MKELDTKKITAINAALNKLISFGEDKLFLDSLDETYMLNKLSELAGVSPVKKSADYGQATLDSLCAELKNLVPDINITAVKSTLVPPAHLYNMYFADEFERNKVKAWDFLYELFDDCGFVCNAAAHKNAQGYVRYAACEKAAEANNAISVIVGDDDLRFVPRVTGNRVGSLSCSDIMAEDIAARLVAGAAKLGLSLVKRIGEDGDYLACETTALDSAKTKQTLSDGAVKIYELDYPAPALKIVGAKNSVARSAAGIIRAASGENIPCVCCCSVGEWTEFKIVFVGDIPAVEFLKPANALTACGVFDTVDLSGLTSVLEKGVALSSDLAEFKPIHNAIGGSKLGAKAQTALTDYLAASLKTALAAAASATSEKLSELVQNRA